jgi:PLP dependent protein
VAVNIAKVRENLSNYGAVQLIAVTKNATIDQIGDAFACGVNHFGESRVQAALKKREVMPPQIEQNSHWHFIGHLQTNKVKQVVGRFSLIHSVDSLRLAADIDRVAKERGIEQSILLQVKIEADDAKGGFTADQLEREMPSLMSLTNIKLEGLMTITPFDADRSTTQKCFAGLKALRDRLSARYDLPLAQLSMGMSDDWRQAVEQGSTMIRLGRAIFGN